MRAPSGKLDSPKKTGLPQNHAVSRWPSREESAAPITCPFIRNSPSSYPKANVFVFMKSRMFAFVPSLHSKQIMVTLTSPPITPQQLKTFIKAILCVRHCTQHPWSIFKELVLRKLHAKRKRRAADGTTVS